VARGTLAPDDRANGFLQVSHVVAS